MLISPDMTAHSSLVTTGFNMLLFDKSDTSLLDKVKLVEEFISITVEGKDSFSLLKDGFNLSTIPSILESQHHEQIKTVQTKFNLLAQERSAKQQISPKVHRLKLPSPDQGIDSASSTTRFLHPNDMLTGRSQHQAYIETSTKTGSKLDTPVQPKVVDISSVSIIDKRKSAVQPDLVNHEYKGRWNPESNKVRSNLGKSMLYSASSANNQGDTIYHTLVDLFNVGRKQTAVLGFDLQRLGCQGGSGSLQHPTSVLLRCAFLFREGCFILVALSLSASGSV